MGATELLLPQADDFNSPKSYSPPDSHGTPSLKRKYSSISSGIPSDIAGMARDPPKMAIFDPAKHLNHNPPKKIYSMAEIGRPGQGISSNAVSEPFPLFTEDAVNQMRAEILSRTVLENCQYSSNLAACHLRGFAPKYAPFIYDAWHSPEVLKIVSDIAGLELIPVMDFEIGHINISINNKENQEETAKALAEHKSREEDEGVSGCPWEDDAPVVGWHTDSYPFVCVLMMSDCSQMIGGETALRTGSGDIMKVRSPGMGNAVILQGRYIEHQALRALGSSERITMVTSFRPKNPLIRDDTVLTTVRAISDLSELYGGYTEYRLEMLEERIRNQLKRMRERKKTGRKFDTVSVKAFLAEQQTFLETMLIQMVDDEKVIAGFTDSSHLISDDLRVKDQMRGKMYLGERNA